MNQGESNQAGWTNRQARHGETISSLSNESHHRGAFNDESRGHASNSGLHSESHSVVNRTDQRFNPVQNFETFNASNEEQRNEPTFMDHTRHLMGVIADITRGIQ